MDIQSMMSLKRESTLQNIKQQQSIKDASMYVGTIYCLLPDGTEPEVQHLFLLFHHPVTLTITCPTVRRRCTQDWVLSAYRIYSKHQAKDRSSRQRHYTTAAVVSLVARLTKWHVVAPVLRNGSKDSYAAYYL